MRIPGGRNKPDTKLQRRQRVFDETVPYDEYGDGRRRWFRTQGHGKLVCHRRPGSNK